MILLTSYDFYELKRVLKMTYGCFSCFKRMLTKFPKLLGILPECKYNDCVKLYFSYSSVT